MSVETDQMLLELGRESERERISKWIEEHRTAIELDAGIYIYREHFDSQMLLDFINGKDTDENEIQE